jgi:hypothetical protein
MNIWERLHKRIEKLEQWKDSIHFAREDLQAQLKNQKKELAELRERFKGYKALINRECEEWYEIYHKHIDELKEQIESLKGFTYNQSDDKWETISNIEEVLRQILIGIEENWENTTPNELLNMLEGEKI